MAEAESIDDLIAESLDLEEQSVAMPAQIFSLARRFADHPDRGQAHETMIEVLMDSPSAFVRRAAFTGIRYAGSYEAETTALEAFLLRGLADEAGWVVYDAVWLAETMGGADPAVRAAVRQVAEGTQPHFKPDSDAWAKARERARKLLER